MDIICVVLGADTKNFRTKDSIKLIEYSFKNFEYFKIKDFVDKYLLDWQNNNSDFFFVEKGHSNQLKMKVDTSLAHAPMIPVKKELIPTIESNLSIQPYWQAPIHENDRIRSITYLLSRY